MTNKVRIRCQKNTTGWLVYVPRIPQYTPVFSSKSKAPPVDFCCYSSVPTRWRELKRTPDPLATKTLGQEWTKGGEDEKGE